MTAFSVLKWPFFHLTKFYLVSSATAEDYVILCKIIRTALHRAFKNHFASLGTGQVVVSYLLDRGYKVRAVLRNKEKAEQIFGHDHDDQLQVSKDMITSSK